MSPVNEIRWAKRVRPELVRRLYKSEAEGIEDPELIDEVGYALLVRCEAILTCTEAHQGRAACPRCKTKIAHNWNKTAALVCTCGWTATWGEYFGSYQHHQLVGGAAFPAFARFADEWPRAKSPRDKMLLIDTLIHACHVNVRYGASRPAAANLLDGTTKELVVFLDQLAYSDLSSASSRSTRDEWRRQVTSGPWGDRNKPLVKPDPADD